MVWKRKNSFVVALSEYYFAPYYLKKRKFFLDCHFRRFTSSINYSLVFLYINTYYIFTKKILWKKIKKKKKDK